MLSREVPSWPDHRRYIGQDGGRMETPAPPFDPNRLAAW